MRFHVRPKPRPRYWAVDPLVDDHHWRRPDDDHDAEWSPSEFDALDEPAHLADAPSEPDQAGEPDSADRLEHLRHELLEVLSDDEASFVPPAAGPMSRRQWDQLPERRRERFRRLQLQRLDPRLVPHTIRNSMRARRASRP